MDDIAKHYRFGLELGKGSFGSVRRAKHKKTDVQCAIKVIRKNALLLHPIMVELMNNELKVLEETTHPHIMRIFELLEDDRFYYIVSELVNGGELYDRILKLKIFNERDAAKIINQVLLAVNYIHK